MKALKFLLLLFFLFNSVIYAQVSITSAPVNMQLLGRDKDTNKGSFTIAGSVNNSSQNFTTIRITVNRAGVLYSQQLLPLTYTGNTALFTYTGAIDAELVNYQIIVESQLSGSFTIVSTITDVVAGDVFVVSGQSNGEARMWSGSASSNGSNFIRTFSGNQNSGSSVLLSSAWFQANGDTFGAAASVGQWGLKLARLLMDDLQIPIAIFNNGEGGKPISYFARPSDYTTSLSTNYGRLFYRLNTAGLRDYVKGIFWHQGETDGGNNNTTAEYKSSFTILHSNWKQDFPNIEHTYLFQIKNGCGINPHEIKEAQRQLADENSTISIIQTDAIVHFGDNCHFAFSTGYEKFALRLYPLVKRDIYMVTTTAVIDFPTISSAYLSTPTILVVTTNASSLSAPNGFTNFQLNSTTGATITNISVSGSNIIFTLSKDPGTATISYLGSQAPIDPGNRYVTNSAGLELICFFKYPIERPINMAIPVLKIGTNPTSINSAAVFELESSNRGFLPPRIASTASISSPPKGMLIYNTTMDCLQINMGTSATPIWKCLSVSSPCVACTATSNTLPISPVLGQQIYAIDDGCIYTYNGTSWMKVCPAGDAMLNCSSSYFMPASMTDGLPYNGTLTIPYTAGKGGLYNLQSVSSIGATGLMATLTSGNYSIGNGNLVFNITGTPSNAGTATFIIELGGSSCNISNPVVTGTGIVTLTCSSAVFSPTNMKVGTPYTGTITIPYTAGNGGTYAARSLSSTGVTGLTAALAAGSFANGAGNLIYNVTGTPTGDGTAAFAISIGGSTCNPSNSVVAGAWTSATLTTIGDGTSTLVDDNTIKTILSYTGSNQTITAPAGATGATIKAWGAGGGGGSFRVGLDARGGSGAFAGGTVSNPSGSFVVVVGQGGVVKSSVSTFGGGGGGGGTASGGTDQGASGGGFSGVFTASVSQANALVIAAGGGGGAGLAANPAFTAVAESGHGGAGGTTTGFKGYNGFTSSSRGEGGSQTAGGAGGTNSSGQNGVAGSSLQGGQGGNATSSGSGGGGGGGFFGGGGAAGGDANNDDAGGGGGSSFIASGLSGSSTIAGDNGTKSTDNTTAGNTSDADFVTGIGAGILHANGGNGRVVIIWTK